MMLLLLSLLATVGPSVAVLERHNLVQRPKAVVVDTLSARIRLVGWSGAQVRALAQKSTLCNQVTVVEGTTLLSCSNRRLTAALDAKGLTFRAMPSPPMTTDASHPPLLHYEPVRFGLGGPCPGDTPSSRGECAFVSHLERQFAEFSPTGPSPKVVQRKEILGTKQPKQKFEGPELAAAAVELRVAFDGAVHRGHAAVRLGDLSWLGGDTEAAARWYEQAGPGVFGRLAASRLAELFSYLDGPTPRLPFDPFDDAGLDPDICAEIALRRARAYAFADRMIDAVHLLVSRGPQTCDMQPALCRKIAAIALRSPDQQMRAITSLPLSVEPAEALTLALTIPSAFDGEGAIELADAVAEHTKRMGAPLFAANVLAATSSQVAPAVLDNWLLRCAELYVEANDAARARAVLSFANSRRFTNGKNQNRWRAIRNRLPKDETDREMRPLAAPKTATKTATKPATKTATKTDTKTATKTDTKTDTKPATKPDTKPDTKQEKEQP